jgi:hypothetical protein
MQKTLKDKVLGNLKWDEDTETYSGKVAFGKRKNVALMLVCNNADEFSASEFKAFVQAAGEQFQELSADDARYRKKAADVAAKVLAKEGKQPAQPLAAALEIHQVNIDNAGIIVLYYDSAGLLPEKNRYVAVALDMSGDIQLARSMRQPE